MYSSTLTHFQNFRELQNDIRRLRNKQNEENSNDDVRHASPAPAPIDRNDAFPRQRASGEVKQVASLRGALHASPTAKRVRCRLAPPQNRAAEIVRGSRRVSQSGRPQKPDPAGHRRGEVGVHGQTRPSPPPGLPTVFRQRAAPFDDAETNEGKPARDEKRRAWGLLPRRLQQLHVVVVRLLRKRIDNV